VRAQIAWSPDGKFLAFETRDSKIRLLPLDGGPSRVLIEGLTGYRPHSYLAWSPDGTELAYATNGRIWKVNLQSRRSEELQTGLEAIHTQMAWSHDGKTIAFSALQGGEPELWLMEDFLPLRQAGR
jgi:WD40 repeat protein